MAAVAINTFRNHKTAQQRIRFLDFGFNRLHERAGDRIGFKAQALSAHVHQRLGIEIHHVVNRGILPFSAAFWV